MAELGFDWNGASSQELVDELNANQGHLLRDARRISIRGRVVEVTPQDVPGITDWCSGRLRSNYQFYLLTPEGKAIDLDWNERDPKGAAYWEVSWTSRFVMPRLLGERSTPLSERRIGWHVGKTDEALILRALRKLAAKYPAKADRLTVPWQKDASFAVRWAKRDQKRILVVAAPGGSVDPVLEELLSSPDLLRRFHRSYSFLKLDLSRNTATPRPGLEALKDAGLAVCDVPGTDCAVEWAGERHPLTTVVEIASGPHTRDSLEKLLEKHAMAADAPTWVQLSRADRGR